MSVYSYYYFLFLEDGARTRSDQSPPPLCPNQKEGKWDEKGREDGKVILEDWLQGLGQIPEVKAIVQSRYDIEKDTQPQRSQGPNVEVLRASVSSTEQGRKFSLPKVIEQKKGDNGQQIKLHNNDTSQPFINITMGYDNQGITTSSLFPRVKGKSSWLWSLRTGEQEP